MTGGRPARLAQLPPSAALVLGGGALFSGVALLAHLLAGFSLPLVLALSSSLVVAAVVTTWLRLAPPARVALRRLFVRALAMGLVATLLYDATRAVFAALDPSPFDPFAAWPIFGWLLLGSAASAEAALAAGVGFHLLNGLAFALAYVFLFSRLATGSGRQAVASGIGWGLFLELFQLMLYPGWLNIATYQEFVAISFAGHVVYGGSLGALTHRFLPLPGSADEAEDG